MNSISMKPALVNHMMYFVTVCTMLLLFFELPASEAVTQPNIVLVVADDLGYNDVSYHGSEIETPYIDQLAAGGLTLENYYVQHLCSPSRSNLMSGRHQIHTGLQHITISRTQPNGLPLDSPTLADKLKQSGYSTHMLGKWHLGYYKEQYLPWNRGFQTFLGIYNGGADHYKYTNRGNISFDLHTPEGPAFDHVGTYSTHLFTQNAVDIINNHDKEKPLFLYLAYQAVHAPLQVPYAYEEKYVGRIQDEKRRIYAGMTSAVDEGTYNVSQALKMNKMWDNTLFIFSTDNGGKVDTGGNNYPLRGGKKELWEGGLHGVAFVTGGVLDPARAGHTSHDLIHISDWFPTFVGLAGGNFTDCKPLDGVDQWGVINSGNPSSRSTLLHNIDPLYTKSGQPLYSDTFDTSMRAAVRSGDFKLLTGDPGLGHWTPPPDQGNPENDAPRKVPGSRVKNVWLFNITADPNERNDLSESRPDIVRSMLELLNNYYKDSVPVVFPDNDPNADPSLHNNVATPWM